MKQERAWLAEALRSLPGLVVFPSAANSLLVELPGPLDASSVAQVLRRQGLLVRDCSTISGLNKRTVRLAVRPPAENRRLVTALRRLL